MPARCGTRSWPTGRAWNWPGGHAHPPLILRRLLRRHVLEAGERNVGLLLPPSTAGALANAAISIDRRVAVNLNYTVSSEVMNQCIAQAGIRHVLTSRRVLERFPLELNAEVVFLEDFKDKVTLIDKLIAAAQTWLLPAAVLERWLGLHRVSPDDLLTIIFTSGSTGMPKGRCSARTTWVPTSPRSTSCSV